MLAPHEIFLDPGETQAQLANFAAIELNSFKADLESAAAQPGVHNFPTAAPRELRIDTHAEQPFAPFESFRVQFGGRVLIAADSAGRREVLHEMLRAHNYRVIAGRGLGGVRNRRRGSCAHRRAGP